jgi:uncharacterized protein
MTTDAPARTVVTWEEIAALCAELATRLSGEHFDAILGIARGGLVPAALLSQELGLRNVLAAAVASYAGDQRGETLHFLEFPPDQAIVARRILVVDDIWDSGRTIELVRRRIAEAGGQSVVAVLHYKPGKSAYPDRQPDFWVCTTDAWILYPWERDT